MLLTSVLSTGLSSFANPAKIGPLYPGAGVEWIYVVFLFVVWVIWHFIQLRRETRELKDEAEHFRKASRDNVLNKDRTGDTMQ